MPERIAVTPEVLTWARKSAGLAVAAAAGRLGVREERVISWEDGTQQPTIVQLRNMAGAYKRPLAVLLLTSPPTDFQPIRDFRRTGSRDSPWSPALHAEFKRALTQRDVFLELDEVAPTAVTSESDDYRSLAGDTSEGMAEKLRGFLGIEKWPRSAWKSPPATLKAAIGAVEALGVLVVQATDIDLKEMRGFSISEWPHPVIVLNASDWPRPKLFTLLHELAHLSLNAGGVCDLHELGLKSLAVESDNVEHFCNRVAASILMPAQSVRELGLTPDAVWTTDSLQSAGARFGASAEAFLLRLVDLKLATWSAYWQLKPELDRGYEAARAAEKARQKATPGGPTFYVLKARSLGPGYIHSVLDAYQSRAITSYDVADYLDVQFHQLQKLREAAS